MRYCQACHRCFGDAVEFCLFDQTPTRENESLPLIIEGKYRLEQLIAHGGMGSVYRATHLSLERPVAIKILRPELLADTTARERFNREARAAARLRHTNIVAVYDFGVLPGSSAYLVMELIEGRSLREEMRAHASRLGQMRPERAAAILVQVCAGIEAAHRQNIIHRDLKPDNVMIESAVGLSADATDRVVVLDFGIAKLAKLEDFQPTWQGLTDENMIIGTPNYISPEQCTGQQVDARSDVYSLGVILYEMLTGHVPFVGENTSVVLLKHLQEPPSPPRRFCQDINPQLEEVVLRALAKNPHHRFSSAAEFAQHITEAIAIRACQVARKSPALEPVAEKETVSYDSTTMTAPRPRTAEAISKRQYKSVHSMQQTTDDTKAPTLIIERRPRRKLFASVFFVVLAAVTSLAYLLYSDWQANADGSEHLTALSPDPVTASSPPSNVQSRQANRALPVSSNDKNAPAVLFEANEPNVPLAEERLRSELKSVYTEWAMSAVRGDWKKHAGYYADRVEYFRDGTMTREKVEARKRNIFGRLDSYWLRFSDSPQIVLKNFAGQQEADVIYDRSWTLRRGRKQTSGRAQGVITLRQESGGWRIVSEKQIKK